MLDENLVKILKQKQAQLIKKSNKTVSFSAVICQTLRKGLNVRRHTGMKEKRKRNEKNS